MGVNLYDVAYGVEKAIRESDEFKQLKQLYDQVNNDEGAKKLFESFRNIQLSLQQKQMMGEDISQEEVEQAQRQVALVQQHDTIAKLMEAEQRMSVVIGELNQIMLKPKFDPVRHQAASSKMFFDASVKDRAAGSIHYVASSHSLYASQVDIADIARPIPLCTDDHELPSQESMLLQSTDCLHLP